MTKRILAVMIATALGICMLSACGKKDDTQTQQTATQESEVKEDNEEAKDTQSEVDAKSEATKKQDSTEPIEMTTEEFEDLVDTFNNPKSDAEKEEARIKLEAVLKQMEQAQQ